MLPMPLYRSVLSVWYLPRHRQQLIQLTLTVRNSVTGCISGAYAISVTVNPNPTITLGANPGVCSGTTSANLTYSATSGTPNQYSIVYSGAALGAGFVNVANAAFPVSPISLVVPAAAAAATLQLT